MGMQSSSMEGDEVGFSKQVDEDEFYVDLQLFAVVNANWWGRRLRVFLFRADKQTDGVR